MKDTSHRSDEPLPVRRSQVPPVAHPVEAYDDYQEMPPPASPGKRVSLRLVGRALRRHWWQALILWIVGSAGMVVFAYLKVQPTFDAVAQIRVERTDLNIVPGSTSTP